MRWLIAAMIVVPVVCVYTALIVAGQVDEMEDW